MKPIKILVDSCADMTKEMLDRFQIDYLPMNFTFDEKTYPATLTWDDFPPHEYYDIMRKGTRIYTNQVPEKVFDERFRDYLNQGFDVLYIGCSSPLSSSVKTGAAVANKIMAEIPGSRIVVIDPLISGHGESFLAMDAALMRDEGKSLDEIVDYVKAHLFNYNEWCTVGSLTYLKNAGRVKASAAFFGNLMGVKPIIISQRNGYNEAVRKVRGRKSALDVLIESTLANLIEPEKHFLGIAHADCPEDAEYVRKAIEEKAHFKEVFVQNLAPILGASCGPDTIIVTSYGKEKAI